MGGNSNASSFAEAANSSQPAYGGRPMSVAAEERNAYGSVGMSSVGRANNRSSNWDGPLVHSTVPVARPGDAVPVVLDGFVLSEATPEELAGRSFTRSGHPVDVSAILRQLRGLETLRLTRCSLADREIAQLCQSGGSSKWSGVKLMDLRDNLLTVACCAAVASVVAGGLEVLIMDGNRLQARGFQTLCAAIKPGQRCGLRWLSVADNDIGHPGGTVAAGLLSRAGGCPLQGLSLARNSKLLGGELGEILKALCRQDPDGGRKLETLDLQLCSLDSALAPTLARTLGQCAGLEIKLHGSPFAIHVAEAGMAAHPELKRFTRANDFRLRL
jgi:hypothetical protein